MAMTVTTVSLPNATAGEASGCRADHHTGAEYGIHHHDLFDSVACFRWRHWAGIAFDGPRQAVIFLTDEFLSGKVWSSPE